MSRNNGHRNDPRRAAELLQAFLDRIGDTEGPAYVGLFQSWREIAGNRIADHTEPVDVRGTALVVEADHPGWVQMVMMSRRQIIERLATRFPELKINGLHVRLATERTGEEGRRSATSEGLDTNEPSPVQRPVSKDETEALANIADSELRDVLSKLRESLEDKE